jgi:phi13 family phage major tail protein
MAYIGLSNPYMAELVDEATKKYKGGFACGKAITVNITPNYNEAKLYANNSLAENEKEFRDGTITLGTDRLPAEANSTCFGHEVSDDGKHVVYKTSDKANNVGVGFYVDRVIDGVKEYEASIVFKTKFSEAANDYQTKGDTIEFKTPSIEGTIAALSTGEWKETKVFDTAEAADTWLREILCISSSEVEEESKNA